MLKQLMLALAMVSAAMLCPAALAQDFPNRAVRIIVPWPPSGNVDITARTVAPALAEALGQQVIVDNRPGAGGTTGTAAVAKSPPDGYTLLLGSSGTVTNAPAVYKNIAYDPVKDLTAIGPIQSVPMVLTAAPKTPVTNFAEFVAYAKAKPGQVSIASAGNGSSNHLALELMMRQTGLKLPNVPTLAELGLSGYEASTFTGLFGPAGMPPAVVEKLHAALRKALGVEAVRARYHSMGVEIMDMTQAEFTAYVRADFEKWRQVAREANIVVE
jgi:tripartite-type tricarboxylate transporter receptor subunit TctC